jgi:type I restriction enzyme M protein
MNQERLVNDFWRACDIIRRDQNCSSIIDYVEHLTWLLFLKLLDQREKVREAEARLQGQEYTPIIVKPYRWSDWIAKAIGYARDSTDSRTNPDWSGDDLMHFVRYSLIQYLSSLSGTPTRWMIANVFSSEDIAICSSPYNLKDVLTIIEGIDFNNAENNLVISQVYENLLQRLNNENRLAGEFYTPRPIVRFVVNVIAPKIGEAVYDPACGSCGFLIEAYEKMKLQATKTDDFYTSQNDSFYAKEKKSIPTTLGIMNMMLHGIMEPHIKKTNALAEEHHDTSQSPRSFDVILTNPPFGGIETFEVGQNFRFKSNATELRFLEHIMNKLKTHDGSRCGIVVPEGVLFREGVFTEIKKELLNTFNLFMIVSLPQGIFAPYSDVKTSILFFERPGPTKEVLYYEVKAPQGRMKFSKGNPISDEYFADAFEAWKQWRAYREGTSPRPELSELMWIRSIESIAALNYDLSAKNRLNPSLEQKRLRPLEITSILKEHNQEFLKTLDRLHEVLLSKDQEFDNYEHDI